MKLIRQSWVQNSTNISSFSILQYSQALKMYNTCSKKTHFLPQYWQNKKYLSEYFRSWSFNFTSLHQLNFLLLKSVQDIFNITYWGLHKWASQDSWIYNFPFNQNLYWSNLSKYWIVFKQQMFNHTSVFWPRFWLFNTIYFKKINAMNKNLATRNWNF